MVSKFQYKSMHYSNVWTIWSNWLWISHSKKFSQWL